MNGENGVNGFRVNGSANGVSSVNGVNGVNGINGVNGLPPGAGQSRMSVASRRAIEELVDQDPNFVAYRYPSVDQNIALLR